MRLHLVDHECNRMVALDAVDDAEFWDRVFHQERPPEPDPPEPDDVAEWELESRIGTPCPECGQRGACAYDAEGRPMIHVVTSED